MQATFYFLVGTLSFKKKFKVLEVQFPEAKGEIVISFLNKIGVKILGVNPLLHFLY